MSVREQSFEPGLAMWCDHGGAVRCARQVRRAPRICVPSRTPLEPGHRPMKIMTTLHYCEEHRRDFDLARFWTSDIKARLERQARIKRPGGWKPDFEGAYIELVLVTTPEYRRFLEHLGLHYVAA